MYKMLTAGFKEKLNRHGARINFLSNFIISLLKVKTVNFAEIASAFPGKAKIESKYKRLQRFFRSFNIDSFLIVQLIVSMLPNKEEQWILTMDRTNWKFGKLNINILVLGCAYKGIAFPLLWMFLGKKGNSNTGERIALIERFIKIFGADKIQFLTADREFIGEEWFRYLLIRIKIPFRIRIRNNTKLSNAQGILVHAKTLFRCLKPGEYQVLEGKRTVWGFELYVCGLRLADGDYLIVVTDKNPEAALEDYARRWEIETLFGCLKSRGFRFESTHLTDYQRIDKLLSLMAVAFCWAYLVGEWLHCQKPITIKKHGRKAKSIFRYGYDHLRTIVLNISENIKEFREILRFLCCMPPILNHAPYN